MKHFAWVTASLAVLGTGVMAQEAAPKTPQIRVTTGSVVTFYPVKQSEIAKQNYTVTADKITADNQKDFYKLEGSVQVQLVKSFKLHADKVSMQGAQSGRFSITLQSDGKIDFVENGYPVTQFVAEGATIEFLSGK